MFIPLMYTLISYVPLGILVVALKWRDRRGESRGRNVPAAGKLLRSPGESTRHQAENLHHQIGDQLLWLLGFPPLLLIVYLVARKSITMSATGVWHVALAMVLIAYLTLALGLVRHRQRRDQLLQGYRGERAVGEELNHLMLDGCRVFHDYPLSKNWNVDHVVVAPSGIYAIETATRKKFEANESQPAHEVVYDGICLQFPNGYDSKSPARACEQAEKLSQILSGDLKETLSVKAILTLPGWYVTCKGEGEVTVVNAKMIRSEILTDEPPVLSPELIKDVARQLERRCRDVEF